jgi:hypothetical protein
MSRVNMLKKKKPSTGFEDSIEFFDPCPGIVHRAENKGHHKAVEALIIKR